MRPQQGRLANNMLPILMVIVSGLITIMAIFSTGVTNPAKFNNTVVLDSLAPESAYYGTAANVTAAANSSMGADRLSSIEQTVNNICRTIYYTGQSNGCSPLNEAFTWAFLFQNGNTGSFNTVQGLASSGTFSCAHPEQYGVFLLNSVYSATDLAGYTYNLMKSDNSGSIGGQADPCAYDDVVN